MEAQPDFVSAAASGRAPLIDLSALPIDAVVAGVDSSAEKDAVLLRSLRQVLESLEEPDGVISAFQSFAS